jgi:hypothetical protein
MANRKRLGKVLIYLLILSLCVVGLYWFGNGKSLTAKMAFRRLEKRHMVGPAEIMEILDFEEDRYDHLLIGRSQYGYTFFEWNDQNPDDGVLTYQPKAEGATLYCTKYSYNAMDYQQSYLPIFAFCDHYAARAKLTLTTNMDGEAISYCLEAQRSEAGYFLFRWKTGELPRGADFWQVQQLITGQYSSYVFDHNATATLELFDTNGQLTETHHFTK